VVSTVNTILTVTGKSVHIFYKTLHALSIPSPSKYNFQALNCEQLLFELQAAVCTIHTVCLVMRGEVFCTVLPLVHFSFFTF